MLINILSNYLEKSMPSMTEFNAVDQKVFYCKRLIIAYTCVNR